MLKPILCALSFLLIGCHGPDRAKSSEDGPNLKNFTACAVMQDYLVERHLVREHPELFAPHLFPQNFIYVDPAAIWNGNPDQTPKSAETSRDFLLKSKDFIESRLEVHIHPGTYDAYNKAQAQDFAPSDCEMPPHIYDGPDGLDLIAKKADHNKDLRFKFSKMLSENRKAFPKKKFDQDEYKAARKKAFETKQLYMLHKFSRIGINRQNAQAIFYHEHYCGDLCAGGNYVIMKFDGDHWRQTGRSMVWVS